MIFSVFFVCNMKLMNWDENSKSFWNRRNRCFSRKNNHSRSNNKERIL